MKICKKCGSDSNPFGTRKKASDGLTTWCLPCIRIETNLNYAKNKERKNYIRNHTRETVKKNKEKIGIYLCAHPCVDCGESDRIVLEFDHVRGTKDRDISKMVQQGMSWEKLEAEINKCEVRCANCHRRATHRRKNQ